MPDTVPDEIIQSSGKQADIPLHDHALQLLPDGNLQFIFLIKPSVQPGNRHGAQQGRRHILFHTKGLHLIFQLGGKIQILYQVFYFQALFLNNSGLPPVLLRKRLLIFQIIRISHHHGKRCADIMGHAGNPFGTGCVPLLQIPSLPVQDCSGLVQLFPQLSRQSLLRNQHPFS